ncbi:MAG TPA: Arc family DNA-binding protein [Rhizomicrobium sp.]|nr:Arc family DNA-binding protein [Rhizomicrobium sp.]
MPVTLSIRDVPDDIAERLRARAKQNHRSMQGELMAICTAYADAAAEPPRAMREDGREFRDDRPGAAKKPLDAVEALKQMRALGVRTKDEVVRMIREDRDR